METKFKIKNLVLQNAKTGTVDLSHPTFCFTFFCSHLGDTTSLKNPINLTSPLQQTISTLKRLFEIHSQDAIILLINSQAQQ